MVSPVAHINAEIRNAKTELGLNKLVQYAQIAEPGHAQNLPAFSSKPMETSVYGFIFEARWFPPHTVECPALYHGLRPSCLAFWVPIQHYQPIICLCLLLTDQN